MKSIWGSHVANYNTTITSFSPAPNRRALPTIVVTSAVIAVGYRRASW
jgi:hypothetical protein